MMPSVLHKTESNRQAMQKPPAEDRPKKRRFLHKKESLSLYIRDEKYRGPRILLSGKRLASAKIADACSWCLLVVLARIRRQTALASALADPPSRRRLVFTGASGPNRR